jgi:predicted PurR-regulated permease PerM
MADPPRERLWIHVPWSTLLKIAAAVAAVWLWHEVVWVLMLVIVAIIIAVGLWPVIQALERRGSPRSAAAWVSVIVIVATLGFFLYLTWSALASQAHTLETRLSELERTVINDVPPSVRQLLQRSGSGSDTSMLTPIVLAIGRGLLSAIAAFGLAWVLVVYLLTEAEETYRWVRGFVPREHRARFDRTAREARDVASGFVSGNVVTSVCAGVYFFIWLKVLGVPAALLLALVAFVGDFIPVIGFFLSCVPALAMGALKSGTVALALVPIYLAYHVIENYLIAPRVYGDRLRLSNVAVLLAFAVGAELGGVLGAVLALPLAAIYPTIERLWLRKAFGEDVIEEHEAAAEETWRRPA